MNPTSASPRDWIAVMAGVLGAFMAALDISITNASLPQIQGEIGATGTEGTWISTSYLIAETIMIPLSAWFVRVFGLRRCIFTCALLFTIFSVICGLAHSLPQMIIGRLGQGFFGGALIPASMTVIALRLPARQQALGMSLFGITVVLAPVFGPVIGGYLTDNVGWYWVFFLNVPVGALLLALIVLGFDAEKSRLEEFLRGDWLGIIGLSLFLGALTVILEEGQREQWWESELIVQLTIAGGIGLVLFAISQVINSDPVLKLRLLRNAGFSGSLIVGLLMGGGYFSVLYVLPIYLGTIAGYNSAQVGMVAMYNGIGSMLAIFVYPPIASRVEARFIIFAGLVLNLAGFFMDQNLGPEWGRDQFFWSQMLRGAGMSLLFFPLSQVALAGIPEHDVPDASGFFNMARNLGGSIGLALTAVLIDKRLSFHTQMIAESLSANSTRAQERLAEMTAGLASRGSDIANAHLEGLSLMAAEIQRQALVMSYADCFWALTVAAIAVSPALLLLPKSAGNSGMMVH